MKVGKLLKDKYGFNVQKVVDSFINMFGYSPIVINKIVNDEYPVLLSCHIHDLALFTGASEEELMEAQELSGTVSELRSDTPMGKPYAAIDPVVGKVDIPTVLTAEMVMETIGKELRETISNKRNVIIANFDYGVAYTLCWESVNDKAEVTQSVIHNQRIVAKFVSTYRTAMNDAVDDGMVSIIVDLVKREKAKVSV